MFAKFEVSFGWIMKNKYLSYQIWIRRIFYGKFIIYFKVNEYIFCLILSYNQNIHIFPPSFKFWPFQYSVLQSPNLSTYSFSNFVASKSKYIIYSITTFNNSAFSLQLWKFLLKIVITSFKAVLKSVPEITTMKWHLSL